MKTSRPCAHCGYDGPFPAPEAAPVAAPAPARDSLPAFAGARAKLATATQDLFRLSGNYSIPVEAPEPEPAPPPEPAIDSSGRKAESSMMFSLEALMKANGPASKPREPETEVSADQLWNMQAATPLFGTAHDQALLTTPLKVEPSPSMDSMTLPSHAPSGRRWWPLALAASAGLALAAGGVWFSRSSSAPGHDGATASSEQSTLAAQPPAALPPVEEPAAAPAPQPAPAPSGEAAPSEAKPAEPSEAAPGEPSADNTADGTAAADPASAAVNAPAAANDGSAAPSDAPAGSGKPEAPKSTARKPPPRAVASLPKAAAFDKAAAKSALSTATSKAASCGQGGAPGKGKIQLTFAPSGKVSDASLVEGPFAGTAAGKCALRQFRAARVPAFAGAPVTVAKSFTIE